MELQVIDLVVDKSNNIFDSEDCQLVLKSYEEYYPKIGFHLPWVGYFVVRQNQIIGSCGFTGRPVNGEVEIAYWTFKKFEGQGIATFSCKQLISIAQQANPTVKITAKTAPEINASTKILQNSGFEFSGVVQDEEIGDAWLWIHKELV